MISVLLLTKNEEINLPDCLQTVTWSDDIHVLDSYSTDNTVNLAKAAGARLWFREFDSFSAQQNWAIREIPFKYPWVFYFDADERVTQKLKDSMLAAVSHPTDNVAFRVQRRDFFLNTWLRHVQLTAFYLRLFRPEHMTYERLGHPVSKPKGPVGTIDGYLDHFPFSKGVGDWLARHNFYSTQEAQQIIANTTNKAGISLMKCLFEKDFNERRRQQKELFYKIPLRPFLKFVATYFLKLGFLDGRAGLTYSTLQAIYEYMIVLKTRELSGSTRPDIVR